MTEPTYREELEIYIWEAYKDAYGIRPRFMNLAGMSIEELEQEADSLSREIHFQIALENAQEAERLASIAEAEAAGDRGFIVTHNDYTYGVVLPEAPINHVLSDALHRAGL